VTELSTASVVDNFFDSNKELTYTPFFNRGNTELGAKQFWVGASKFSSPPPWLCIEVAVTH
jgi:hypothetical protein